MSDPYSSPEAYGLTIVGSISDHDEPYQYDMLIVWQHTNGTIYYARDSGCSCPSPFENYSSLEQLTKVADWFGFSNAVLNFSGNPVDKVGLLRKVSDLMVTDVRVVKDQYVELARRVRAS